MTEPIISGLFLVNGPEHVFVTDELVYSTLFGPWPAELQARRKVKRGRHKEMGLSHHRWCRILAQFRNTIGVTTT